MSTIGFRPFRLLHRTEQFLRGIRVVTFLPFLPGSYFRAVFVSKVVQPVLPIGAAGAFNDRFNNEPPQPGRNVGREGGGAERGVERGGAAALWLNLDSEKRELGVAHELKELPIADPYVASEAQHHPRGHLHSLQKPGKLRVCGEAFSDVALLHNTTTDKCRCAHSTLHQPEALRAPQHHRLDRLGCEALGGEQGVPLLVRKVFDALLSRVEAQGGGEFEKKGHCTHRHGDVQKACYCAHHPTHLGFIVCGVVNFCAPGVRTPNLLDALVQRRRLRRRFVTVNGLVVVLLGADSSADEVHNHVVATQQILLPPPHRREDALPRLLILHISLGIHYPTITHNRRRHTGLTRNFLKGILEGHLRNHSGCLPAELVLESRLHREPGSCIRKQGRVLGDSENLQPKAPQALRDGGQRSCFPTARPPC
eukprot:Hpha_TRINITY_DN9352_c0_g1::TRINITY_DN9352_c0_g1_i1::g.25797::m.25797